MEEPSVLDYLKSILMPWKGQRIHLPDAETDQADDDFGLFRRNHHT